MYEALDNQTKVIYRGNTVAELRVEIEASLNLEDVPQQYYSTWSNSRCVTYLVQADYITPYSGPEWFMALKPESIFGEASSENTVQNRCRTEFIDYDGSINVSGETRITFWQERNHVRLLFKDRENIYAEIFLTEESLRNLWVCMGKQLGFDTYALHESIRQLPQAQIYTPETPPEKFRIDSEDAFNILRAISELDLDLDDDNDIEEDDSPF